MPFFVICFSKTQVTLLLLAFFTFLCSLYCQVKEKENLTIGFLIITAFMVFCFAALLDPFLNVWDERFHALVGKNLMHHPLMPTLYDNPVVNMAYDRWDRYHIWLHKQPLFLWQIALSFKLFGVSEFTLRIPDIILGTILVFVSYRSGKLLVNQRVGFLTGILTMSTLYLVELAAGRQEVDHNDFSFIAYVSFSIWSFIEYYYSKKKYWIYLIAVFSGMAILCKWIVGLLIYLGWIVLKFQQRKFKPIQNKELLIALFITLLIVLPWQILTFVWYPAEAIQAFKLNALHFTTAVDGQRGTFWYHFDRFSFIYGTLASFLIIPSFYFFYKDSKDKLMFFSLLSMVAAVYLFFSLAVSKDSSFPVVAAMVILIAFASLFDNLFRRIEQFVRDARFRNLIFIVSVVIVVLLRFDVELLQARHTTWKEENSYTPALIHNKEVFKSLKLPGNAVLFNVLGRHYVEAMFYTGLPAYNFIPTAEQYSDMKAKGRCIGIFKPVNSELPAYLTTDTTVIIINKEIAGPD